MRTRQKGAKLTLIRYRSFHRFEARSDAQRPPRGPHLLKVVSANDTSSLLSAGPFLIVSPHMDDAAFSCAALLELDEPVDILTVFAGAPDPPRVGCWWDVACGFADSNQSMRVRLAEERAAFAGSQHGLMLLDLLDGQYLDGPRTAIDSEKIAAAIRGWIDRIGGGVVAIPAGAGADRSRIRSRLRMRRGPAAHPDHIFVRDAALWALVEFRSMERLIYEEFPYQWGKAADGAVRKAARRFHLRPEPFELEVDRVAKATRISAYPSQIGRVGGPRLDDPEALPAQERYWRLAPN